MIWVNTDGRVPIKSWCAHVEPNAMRQAMALSNHPSVYSHVALMPDCHTGYGMPIGGVIACKDAVIPNAVGVDIGCGMVSVRTSIHTRHVTTPQLQTIIQLLKDRVPMGMRHHKKPHDWEGFHTAPHQEVVQSQIDSACKQIGTLGGGNHFIEIQTDEHGFIFFMIHSGSRNIGFKIANHYNKLASELCDRYGSVVKTGQEGLAYFPLAYQESNDYIEAMNFALDFAKENRKRLMEQLLSIFHEVTGYRVTVTATNEAVDVHHNFARREHHFGKNLWVHRKGATPAFIGQLCIIPGSMGTNSYVLKGRGNANSFMSCSHGAGRTMGRGEFTRSTNREACDKEMEGIVFSGWTRFGRGKKMRGLDLSEAPSAYKDINKVIAAQSDLVEVVHTLTPIAVAKG